MTTFEGLIFYNVSFSKSMSVRVEDLQTTTARYIRK